MLLLLLEPLEVIQACADLYRDDHGYMRLSPRALEGPLDPELLALTFQARYGSTN